LHGVPSGNWISAWGREHKIKTALWAFGLPLLERIDDNRGEGNVALARLRLRRPYAAPCVGPLANMDHARFKIDIGPARAAQFAQPHSGEDRSDDKTDATAAWRCRSGH